MKAAAGSVPGADALSARRFAGRAYDEAVAPNGNPRPHYRSIWPLALAMSAARRQRSLRKGRALFGNDNAVHPLPRLLTASEYRSLEAGVIQRGTALRMFLQDHYSGEKRYRAVLSTDVVDAIIARSGEFTYQGLLDPKQIAFPYGPDLMRGPDGKFYVVEDNTGHVGGPGDLLLAREALLAMTPELERLLSPLDEPDAFYSQLVARARELARPKNGRIVMLMVPPYPDREDQRYAAIMRRHGVEVLTPNTRHQLRATREGLFVEDEAGERARIGYVFLSGEHKWVDASHPATRPAYLLWEAEYAREHGRFTPQGNVALSSAERERLDEALAPQLALHRVDFERLQRTLEELDIVNAKSIRAASKLEGIVDATLRGKVASNYSPGVDFIGDKQFKGHIDDLVRFYLHQEPILKSIPVTRFTRRNKAGEEVLDRRALRRKIEAGAHRRHVFKVVDGRGGKGIYIGPKLRRAELNEAKDHIAREPTRYIAEPFVSPSVLDGHIVDQRPLAMVDHERVIVSPTPWGRGVPLDGNGKVNLSQKGREFPIVVVSDDGRRAADPARGPAKRWRAPQRPRGIPNRSAHPAQRHPAPGSRH